MVLKSPMLRRCVKNVVRARVMPRTKPLLVLAVALGLGGCSSTFSDLPTQLGGMPAGTPERSAAPAVYPAVHDMPPPRQNAVLTDEERKRAEAELAALRARQEKQANSTSKDQKSDQRADQ
jgi:hypothetical protein